MKKKTGKGSLFWTRPTDVLGRWVGFKAQTAITIYVYSTRKKGKKNKNPITYRNVVQLLVILSCNLTKVNNRKCSCILIMYIRVC